METTVTTPITVQNVQDGGWKYTITAECTWVSRDYPVNQISMNKKLGDYPEIGKTYLCTLERGNLRKYQDGREKDDSKTWNWFWDIAVFDIQQDTAPTNYASKDEVPYPATTQSKPFNTQSDVNPTTRLNITASHVRTALMQSVEMGKADGIVTDATDIILERSDELLKYLNDRTFGSSPLVAKAIMEGATVSEIRPNTDPIPQQEMHTPPSAEMYAELMQNWKIPNTIASGKDFKEVCISCGFEMEWVMEKFRVMGISKSADYVSSERGSYQDLAIILCSKAVTEGMTHPDSSTADTW